VTFVSKSKYLAGLQCSKLLWYYYNSKEHIPATDEATQAIFDQGHEIGELAKSLFPGGIDVAKGVVDFAQVVRQSVDAVKTRKPLFEAAFRYKNAYARADILKPTGGDRWDIIEVKSSTQVKDINLHDLALQRYAYEGTGLKIRNCGLMHINNEYVRQGRIDPKQLFVLEDVTRQVAGLLPQVEHNLEKMLGVIRLKKHPDIPIGPHCSDPYECILHEMCWDSLPNHNVFTLYRLGQKAFGLLEQGVQQIIDIPADYKLSAAQSIQLRSVKTRRPNINKPAIASFLKDLVYPLYFLDFETFGTAIPLFDKVRPYQQIPFQFSLHIAPCERGKAEHHCYLGDGSVDPRPEILSRLKALLNTTGSIICYNAPFERARIRESCDVYSQFSSWWKKTEPRVLDLLGPFRAFHYYHPDQCGSASIKAVLPALTGKGYGGMSIADGGAASREYLRVTFGQATSVERQKVRKQLEEYCKLDTHGMLQIVTALKKMSSKHSEA
jgi:hypothetical protein